MTDGWKEYYQSPTKSHWKGRVDGPGAERFHEAIQLLDFHHPNRSTPKKENFALLGFCSDAGIKSNLGRPGAADGPDFFREALSKFPAASSEIYDAGNIICPNEELEKAQNALSEAVADLLGHGFRPILIGGGHEIAWGHFLGIEKANPGKEIAIINFDAHFDLRPLQEGLKGNSGTSFFQIARSRESNKMKFDYTCIGIQPNGNTHALFEQAKSLNVSYMTADDIHLGGIEPALELVDEIITRSDQIYVSICLDVFGAAYAPGVSAPQPLGLSPWQVIPLLRHLASKGKTISLDLAELSPKHDRDGMTANLAASLASNFISYSRAIP